jgi:molybdopterin molybdotransferase
MPVAQALALVLRDASPLPAEAAPLTQAHGRVLADDLTALRTQPPADVSAMDGYAVRAVDVATAPATLALIGEVAAGRPFDGTSSSTPAARTKTWWWASPPAKAATFVPKGSTSQPARCCCGADAASATAIWRWRRP